jgi:hypothetical protein
VTTRYFLGREGSDGGRYTVYEYDDAPNGRGQHRLKLASGHEMQPMERDGEFRTKDGAQIVWIDLAHPSRSCA